MKPSHGFDLGSNPRPSIGFFSQGAGMLPVAWQIGGGARDPSLASRTPTTAHVTASPSANETRDELPYSTTWISPIMPSSWSGFVWGSHQKSTVPTDVKRTRNETVWPPGTGWSYVSPPTS